MQENNRPLYSLTVEEFKEVFFKVIKESVNDIVKENIRNESDNLLRISEVQSMLKISRPSIYKLIKTKRLKKFKLNGSTFFKKENVLALIKEENDNKI